MELTQLRYFVEAARLEHMTKAAERLHIAQPALTQAIHRLEQELQLTLFMPKGRGVKLTPCGELLFKRAEELLDRSDAMVKELRAMAGLEEVTVRINVEAASYVVTQSVIEYKRKENDVHFKLGHNESVWDVTVTTEPHRERDSSEDQYVFTENIFLAVPMDKYKGDTVKLEEVKDEGFISLAGSWQLGIICNKFCSYSGFEPNVLFQSDNPISVKNIIAAGAGVGFWPEYAWGELDNKGVRLLKITEPDCKRDIIIKLNKERANGQAKLFFEYIIGYFDAMKRQREQKKESTETNDQN